MSFTSKQTAFIDAAVSYNETTVAVDFDSVSKIELTNIAESAGLKFPHWLTRVPTYKVDRGLWRIPVNGAPAEKAVVESPVEAEKAPEPVTITSKPAAPVSVVEMTKGSTSTVNNIPNKDPLFVPFGNFTDVVSIFKSKMFYPIYVTGLSGNGKTFMIEQAAAKAARELFRVNITIETDEDDLLGGFRLVDGETVWFDGPIVEAMRKGALVLLDEVDLAKVRWSCWTKLTWHRQRLCVFSPCSRVRVFSSRRLTSSSNVPTASISSPPPILRVRATKPVTLLGPVL